MIRKGSKKMVGRAAAVIAAAALTAGLFGCAKTAETASAEPESAVQESTVQEPINPEQVKSEDVIKEKESAVPAQAQAEPEPSVIEKPEPSVIEKPEPSEESEEGKAETEAVNEEEKEKESAEEKKEGKPAADLNDVLDGVMSFDGMTLEFPIELSKMKLGKWTLTYEIEGDPADKTVQPKAVVLARMTNPDYTDNDVIVMAEFGNYTDSEAKLTDLPMTGIYITKGKGTDKAEAGPPSLELPCGFTWGTSEQEIREQLGEASLSGSFDYEFDYMYENGSYQIELAGMSDTGLEYVVYAVE